MTVELDRRAVLKGLGLSFGGLVIGFAPRLAQAGTVTAKVSAFAPNPFIHIAPDGVVSLVCARSEMGQGVRSTLPVLLADELGAVASTVRIVQGDGDEKYGDQNTDGSTSVRSHWKELRQAAAAARMMLISAAAKQWSVPEAECTARDGQVIHNPSQRTSGFGSLVAQARELKVPSDPVLRPRAELTHLGTRLPLVDAPDIVTGKAIYGADVKLPGLLYAVVLHPPVVRAKLRRYDASKALAVPGVKHVIEIPHPGVLPLQFKPLGGLAVVATDTWSALKGRALLEADWEAGDNALYDSDDYNAALSKTVNSKQSSVRSVGDVEKAMKSAGSTLKAEYHVPHLAHATMESPCATAKVMNGIAEVWTSTQNPQAARDEVISITGLPEANVTVHVTLLGGGFGRKSKPDYVAEAAYVSQQVKAPVRLQWTREDDIQHDYYHTTATHRIELGLDAEKKPLAWLQRVVFPPISTLLIPIIKSAFALELQQGILDTPLAIPNVEVENGAATEHVRIGWLRSVNNIHAAFAMASFIDEYAHEKQLDPKQAWLEILGPPRIVTPKELGLGGLNNYGASLEEHPIDTARLRNVIERVTQASGWDARSKDPHRAYGLAAHRSFLTYVATVAAVVKDPVTGKVKVDEMWMCADAGTVLNLERAHSQLEGAAVFGLGIAFFSEITAKAGSIVQSNFRDYRVARMSDAPRAIHVDVVPSEGPPGGIGEPGLPPVAPAIVNAVFALTGKRVRELPLSHTGLV